MAIKVARWAIDIDGVITANPSAMSWLLWHLLKNENSNEVYLLSWRDGSDPVRVEETERDLTRFGIRYTKLLMAPKKFSTLRQSAFWKMGVVRKYKIDIWFDNDLKIFNRDFGINVDRLLPDVIKVQI